MTLIFTRVATDETTLPDGKYIAEIIKAEQKEGNSGEKISIQNMIVSPEEYKGRFIWDNFSIGSDKPEYKEKALRKFNKYWSEMTDDEDGTIEDLHKIVGKEISIVVKNFIGNDGETRPYIMHHSRLDKPKKSLSMFTPQSPQANKETLNDDIPF